MSPARIPHFTLYLGRIFTAAVEASRLRDDLRLGSPNISQRRSYPKQKLMTVLSKQVGGLASNKSANELLRRAVIASCELHQDRVLPAVDKRAIDKAIDAEGRLTSEMQDLLLATVRPARQGRDWSIQRQMVRGLAALLHDTTGKVPARSHRSRGPNLQDYGEIGRFHRLCEALNERVDAALAVKPWTKQTPSLCGLVNEELKLLKAEVLAKKRLEASLPKPK
jgi:hypothetical protein